MMAPFVYLLCVLTTTACAGLLLRGYLQTRKQLLLWSGLCFVGMALSNLLIFVDLVVVPDVDLYKYRLIAATLAMALLVYGLIWESKS